MNSSEWLALERHLAARQQLAPSTIAGTLRALAALQRDGLDLRHPLRSQFERIVLAYRRRGMRATGLHEYHKAVRRLLRARGIAWPEFRAPRVPPASVHVPADDVVRELLELGADDQDDDEAATARFCFGAIAYAMLRPPSELVALRVDDVDPALGLLRVYAPKTGREDLIALEPWLRDHFRAYARRRDRLALPRERAFLVHPRTGRAWTSSGLRMCLTRHGRRVYPAFHPYLLRHWGAARFLRAVGYNVLELQARMRHRDLASTERYVHAIVRELRARPSPLFLPLTAGAETEIPETS